MSIPMCATLFVVRQKGGWTERLNGFLLRYLKSVCVREKGEANDKE